MKDAMRAKDTVRLESIRMLRAAIQRKELDDKIDLDDEGVLVVIEKSIKQSRDAAEQFVKGERQDLADKENQNIDVLQEYMPEALGKDEIAQLIEDAMQQTSASSMKDMGKVMGLLKPQIQGRADMGSVSTLIKERLS